MIYKLYVKKCTHCDLKYFGFTTKSDVMSYRGSGIKWKAHLDKYSADQITLSSWIFDSGKEAKEFAIRFSTENNIVESKHWANLVVENAQHGVIFTEEMKLAAATRLKGTKRPRAAAKMKGRIPWNKGKKGCQTPWNKIPVILDGIEYPSREEVTKKLGRTPGFGQLQKKYQTNRFITVGKQIRPVGIECKRAPTRNKPIMTPEGPFKSKIDYCKFASISKDKIAKLLKHDNRYYEITKGQYAKLAAKI